ncbi:MAG TPA: iron-sulfur cluster assembly accessory protein [Polyangiales bacterium]|jgi:iron-sulfur cluster assembly protein|nr:iron-sulfur cluster assembly accessory protein [Polyangiales bacterium]
MSLNRSTAPKTDPSEHIPVLAANSVDESQVVRLTKKAIEMAKSALVKRGTPSASLRLGVRGGGCSGVSYAIEFSDKVRDRDHKFDFEGLQVVVDPKSLVYLRGSVLDYEVKLMQHGFRFVNPNEKSGCGCGESFQI